MTKIGRFLSEFSVVDFSAVGFLFLKTQRQKSLFLYKSDFHWKSNAFLCFDFQTHGFTSRKKWIEEMFSCFKKSDKKIYYSRLFISAMSHAVKLTAETRVYLCQENMNSLFCFVFLLLLLLLFFFYSFSKVFAQKYIKNILQVMKNGLSLTTTITSDYVLHDHLSIS